MSSEIRPNKPAATTIATTYAAYFAWAIGGAPPASNVERGQVLRILDGDTIEIRYLSGGEAVVGHIEKVRYLGIDTPEKNEPGGAEATEFNRARVEGQTVRLVREGRNRDNFGRLLRHVFVVYQGQEIDVVAALIAAGHVKGQRINDRDHRHSWKLTTPPATPQWARCMTPARQRRLPASRASRAAQDPAWGSRKQPCLQPVTATATAWCVK